MVNLDRGIFISGTGTGVGKTVVAAVAAILLKRRFGRVAVFKPVASGGVRLPDRQAGREGSLVSEDALFLKAASGSELPLERINPFCFEAPLAPPLAARREGMSVDWAAIESAWSGLRGAGPVVVEGAGGLFSPVAEGKNCLDLARLTGLPVWLVVGARLGMIHQAVAACEAAKHHGLAPAAFVVNGISDEHPEWEWDAGEIRRMTGIPCAGRVPRLEAGFMARPEILAEHPGIGAWFEV